MTRDNTIRRSVILPEYKINIVDFSFIGADNPSVLEYSYQQTIKDTHRRISDPDPVSIITGIPFWAGIPSAISVTY
jgi:hypothetical protein